MSRPRDNIHGVRDFDKFLRSRGFTKKETRILCRAWHDLAENAAARCGNIETAKTGAIGDLIKEKMEGRD